MSDLTIYLNDGTREDFTLTQGGGFGYGRYEYKVGPEVLTVIQADVVHCFPLVSIRKWEVRE